MKHSERSDEGIIYLDHREGPGLTDEFIHETNKLFPHGMALPYGAGKGLFEAATITCGHCQRGALIDTKRREGPGRCPNCFRRLCKLCNSIRKHGGTCTTIQRVINDIQEAAVKQESIQEI